MSFVTDEFDRSQYSMFLAKKIRQRPEHLASKYGLGRHPHMHGWIFINLYKWESIPEHFRYVLFAINRKGPTIDGTCCGEYALTLHGRGRTFGQNNAAKVRYLAGCSLSVSADKCIVVKDIRCHFPPFTRLIESARVYDKSYQNKPPAAKSRNKRNGDDDEKSLI
jgi:hypothetical protein